MTEKAKSLYNLISKIPIGKITTYKIVGDTLGIKSYRAVGQILKRNPDAPTVPCHRVVKTNGELGGYDGSRIADKIRILETEGVKVENGKVVNFENIIYKF